MGRKGNEYREEGKRERKKEGRETKDGEGGSVTSWLLGDGRP